MVYPQIPHRAPGVLDPPRRLRNPGSGMTESAIAPMEASASAIEMIHRFIAFSCNCSERDDCDEPRAAGTTSTTSDTTAATAAATAPSAGATSPAGACRAVCSPATSRGE